MTFVIFFVLLLSLTLIIKDLCKQEQMKKEENWEKQKIETFVMLPWSDSSEAKKEEVKQLHKKKKLSLITCLI